MASVIYKWSGSGISMSSSSHTNDQAITKNPTTVTIPETAMATKVICTLKMSAGGYSSSNNWVVSTFYYSGNFSFYCSEQTFSMSSYEQTISFEADSFSGNLSDLVNNYITITPRIVVSTTHSSKSYVEGIQVEFFYEDYADTSDIYIGSSSNSVKPGEQITLSLYGSQTLLASGNFYIGGYVVKTISNTSYATVTLPSSFSVGSTPTYSFYATGGTYGGKTIKEGYIGGTGTLTVVSANNAPTLSNVTFSPSKGVSGASNSIKVTLTANDPDGNTLTYQYKLSSSSSWSTFTNGSTLSLIGGSTYNFRVVDSNGATSSTYTKTLESISALTISLTATINKQDGSFVKIIDRLAASGNKTISSYSWTCYYGPNSNASTYSASISLSNPATNLDIGEKIEDIKTNGYYYKIRVTGTSTADGVSQTAYKETSVYKYPQLPNAVTNLSIYNKDYTSNYTNTNGTDFNRYAYINLTLPENGGSTGYPTLSLLNIMIKSSNSISGLSTATPKSFMTLDISNEDSSLVTKQLTIDLEGINIVPRGSFFSFVFSLTDKVGGSESYSPFGENYRILLPTFGETTHIGSSVGQEIKVNQLPDGWNWELAFPAGSLYTQKSYGETADDYVQKIIDTIKYLRLTVQPQSIGENINELEVDFTTSNLKYTLGDSTGRLTITKEDLKQILIDYTLENTRRITNLTLILEDAFGNTTALNTIRFPNETIDSYVAFIFGVPPVLPDYNASLYDLKIKYPGSATYSNFNTDLASDINKNMVNKGDTLRFSLPIATDANGNDTGAIDAHGDLVGYRIKICRLDDMLTSIENLKEDNFTLYRELTFVNDLTEAAQGGLYFEEVTATGSSVSKFCVFGICAFDTTNSESNLVKLPYYVVSGRVTTPTVEIISHNSEKSSNTINYSFNLRVRDLGGNSFIDKTYLYSGYPNLERTINSQIHRNIKFTLQYSEDNVDFVDYTLKVRRDEDDTYFETYPTNITYSNFTNGLIFTNGTDFSENGGKRYFRIKIEIKIGPNESDIITGYSSVYIIYPSTVTVAYRQNHVGINTDNFSDEENEVLVVSDYSGRHKVVLRGFDSELGLDREITIDLRTGRIDGVILDCGRW